MIDGVRRFNQTAARAAARAIVDRVGILVDPAEMASITIRKLRETTKARLRIRAACHGRSMEEEARQILRAALGGESSSSLADAAHRRFEPLGGVELDIPPREPMRQPPKPTA